MEQEYNCSSLDEFMIVKTLGSGYHATVKKGIDKDGNQVAIKRYRLETGSLATLSKQIHIMRKLNHENLVKLIDARDKAVYRNHKGQTYNCLAIILEFQARGQLFDYLAKTGRFSEIVTRTYFSQIMNGLHHLHQMGFTHRDIKPENLLLSKDFILKIADFGFSTVLQGKDGSGILRTHLGSEGYKAPEIAKNQYVGTQIDVFASGVILFIMLKGAPPFSSTNIDDRVYALIKDKNYKQFWALHSKKHPKMFNEKFKDLFIKMVAFNPNERATIQEIAQHPWIKDNVCTHSEIIEEFTERFEKIQEGKQAAERIEEDKRQARMGYLNQNGPSRGKDDPDHQFYQLYIGQSNKKRTLTVRDDISSSDGFKLNQKVEYFLANLKIAIEAVQPSLDEDKKNEEDEQLLGDEQQQKATLKLTQFKDIPEKNEIKLTYEYQENLEEEISLKTNIQLMISLGIDNKNNLLVDVSKIQGQHLLYKKIAEAIKKPFLYCLT